MQRPEREHLMVKMPTIRKQYQKSEGVDLVAFYVLPLLIQMTRMLKFLKQQRFVQHVLCLYATKRLGIERQHALKDFIR
jgi:hypothetical protein